MSKSTIISVKFVKMAQNCEISGESDILKSNNLKLWQSGTRNFEMYIPSDFIDLAFFSAETSWDDA